MMQASLDKVLWETIAYFGKDQTCLDMSDLARAAVGSAMKGDC